MKLLMSIANENSITIANDENLMGYEHPFNRGYATSLEYFQNKNSIIYSNGIGNFLLSKDKGKSFSPIPKIPSRLWGEGEGSFRRGVKEHLKKGIVSAWDEENVYHYQIEEEKWTTLKIPENIEISSIGIAPDNNFWYGGGKIDDEGYIDAVILLQEGLKSNFSQSKEVQKKLRKKGYYLISYYDFDTSDYPLLFSCDANLIGLIYDYEYHDLMFMLTKEGKVYSQYQEFYLKTQRINEETLRLFSFNGEVFLWQKKILKKEFSLVPKIMAALAFKYKQFEIRSIDAFDNIIVMAVGVLGEYESILISEDNGFNFKEFHRIDSNRKIAKVILI